MPILCTLFITQLKGKHAFMLCTPMPKPEAKGRGGRER